MIIYSRYHFGENKGYSNKYEYSRVKKLMI